MGAAAAVVAGRRRAACALTLDSVPVIVREIDSPLVAELILIDSNRQREKTASERMHESENLTRIFAEENRRKMLAGQTSGGKTAGRGRPKTDDSCLPTLAESSHLAISCFTHMDRRRGRKNEAASPGRGRVCDTAPPWTACEHRLGGAMSQQRQNPAQVYEDFLVPPFLAALPSR